MKFCGKCGTQVEDNVTFCPSCGNPFPGAPQPQAQRAANQGGFDFIGLLKADANIPAAIAAAFILLGCLIPFQGVYGINANVLDIGFGGVCLLLLSLLGIGMSLIGFVLQPTWLKTANRMLAANILGYGCAIIFSAASFKKVGTYFLFIGVFAYAVFYILPMFLEKKD